MLNQETLEHQAILSLSKAQFLQFLLQKMYKLNKNFNTSQQCISKLANFIKEMQVTKQTIKIAKNIIKYYGVGILIFFQQFYQKIKTMIQETSQLKIGKISEETKNKIQKMQKLIDKCKEISQISIKIVHPFQIQYLKFIRLFEGVKILQKRPQRTTFQNEYLQFLEQISKKYVKVVQKKIKEQFKSLIKWIQNCRISREFNQIQKVHLSQLKDNLKIKSDENIQQKIFLLKDPKNFKQQLNKIPLCCRTSFFQNELILQAESINLEYKNYRFPYDLERKNVLAKTICGFLNGNGGTILIGIYQAVENKKKFVKGQFYSQSLKQKVLVEFRYICNQIFPQIVNEQLYSVKFVPIKTNSNDYIRGKYIIRVKIKSGGKQNMYSYFQQDQKGQTKDFFAFRTENQILKRSLNQDILKIYRQRLQNKQNFTQIHFGDCSLPELGIPVFNEKLYQEKQYKIEQIVSSSLQQKHSNDLKSQTNIQVYNNFDSKQLNNQKDKNEVKNSWAVDQDEEDFAKKKSLQRKLRQIIQNQKQNQKAVKLDCFNMQNNSSNILLKKQTKKKQYVRKSDKKEQINSIKVQIVIQYLFLNIPFKQIQSISEKFQLPLAHKPIKCKSDNITWLKIKNSQNVFQKMQQIKKILNNKKKENPKLKFTHASQVLCTSVDQFKVKFRSQNIVLQKEKQEVSYFEFQNTYQAIKVFLKHWVPGQNKIGFSIKKEK